jgi:hypothetical protein
VSRVSNADQFLLAFRRIVRDYERLFRPRLVAVRAKYTQSPLGRVPEAVDSSLEAHGRAYLVNALLAALNWRLNYTPNEGLPNLVPEAPVTSDESGHIRFLDYLGFERYTDHPLLIVEAKRPSESLPRLAQVGDSPPLSSIPEGDRGTVPLVVCRGLIGEPLLGAWNQWLQDLKDYVCSVKQHSGSTPRRVISTNGDWLILFLNPADTFLPEGTQDPGAILVFESRADLEDRHTQVFRYLEYSAVAGEIPGLTPGEVNFHVSGTDVDRILHGLRLRYFEKPQIYLSASPVIRVAPVLYLRTRHGAWLRVEAPPKDFELPHRRDELALHQQEVEAAARALLQDVRQRLHLNIEPTSLAQHYQDTESFELVPGVVERSVDEFVILTGDKTHYILPEPTVPNCPYHDWLLSYNDGVSAQASPVLMPSTDPRSSFISGENHHCTHRDVVAAKESSIDTVHRERCGPRSGGEGAAFCEIWRFETRLCCRTCVFEDVCTKAEVFQLPCRRPEGF